jgi:hypothetical protein
MDLVQLDCINLGDPAFTGHEVYPHASFSPLVGGPTRKVVFKRNKFDKARYSRMEVAFSQLARLFLGTNLTSHQALVCNSSGSISGLAVEHLCYILNEKVKGARTFYLLSNPTKDCTCSLKQIDAIEDIPYYFLDKLPRGFFAKLMAAAARGELTIDYSSLASILTSSYTLEEDDLHKGNFGFSLIQRDGKPEAIFFKIDHDLMFVDSVMSFCTRRPYHFFDGEHAFDITADDVLNFPSLKHSANSYWPTKKSKIFSPWDVKGYCDTTEVSAFSNLAQVPEFRHAKWLSFYKHILVPEQLLESTLSQCLDKSLNAGRAQSALLMQSTIARQAQLRAMLFSLKEFREFVGKLTAEEQGFLIDELLHHCPIELKKTCKEQIEAQLSSYKSSCERGVFEEGDTPVHVAIKLGDFRYQETMRMYGQCVNQKNASGKSPLDVAVELAGTGENRSKDIRKDVQFTMNYLLSQNAQPTPSFTEYNNKAHVEQYEFGTNYLQRAKQADSYQELKEVLRDVGEDYSFSLKYKKMLAVRCIEQFIEGQKNNPRLHNMLLQLNDEVNGCCSTEDAAGLKYIRQLRSRLWVVRQVRGLYGRSSTQEEINDLIHNALKEHPVKSSQRGTFFSRLVDKCCITTEQTHGMC